MKPKLSKITNARGYLSGEISLPAGAVPLAEEQGGIVCLMPSGEWITFLHGISTSHKRWGALQIDVVDVIVQELGGTAENVGRRLELSKRTIEAWRRGHSKMSARAAYRVLEAMRDNEEDEG